MAAIESSNYLGVDAYSQTKRSISQALSSVRNLQYPKGKHAQLHSENENDSHSVVSDSLQPNGLYSPLFMEFSRPEYWSG